jgi:mono/diheme cytochrome c family protein
MRRSLTSNLFKAILLVSSLHLYAGEPRHNGTAVQPVAGESWLNHLHRSFGETSMGKTGRLGPPPSEEDGQGARWRPGLLSSSNKYFTVRGQDLYRLNCQACHGEKGLGAPPEINSILDPVRATSVPLMLERMKQRGMDITPAAASEMAKQAQNSLLERLHKGGQSMPPFSHLNDAEVRTLVEYVKQLSGVPGSRQVTVLESPLRVGELIVKSTCHICHDATGANPTPAQLEDDAIPPLETLTGRTDEVQFIRKVTSGAPVVLGTPPMLYRGRMPVFYYLSREEAADVYLYLDRYPPSRFSAQVPVVAGTTQQNTTPDNPPPPTRPSLQPSSIGSPVVGQERTTTTMNWLIAFALLAVGGFVASLLLLGCGIGCYLLSRAQPGILYSNESRFAGQSTPTVPDVTGANCRRM